MSRFREYGRIGLVAVLGFGGGWVAREVPLPSRATASQIRVGETVDVIASDNNHYIVSQVPQVSTLVDISNRDIAQYTRDGFLEVIGVVDTVCEGVGTPSQLNIDRTPGTGDIVMRTAPDCTERLLQEGVAQTVSLTEAPQ